MKGRVKTQDFMFHGYNHQVLFSGVPISQNR